MAAPYTSVSDFFTGRSIFVTGGTGFMGKVLVEKLLRSCPGVKNIYLLMRPKRGQDVNSRLRELLSAPLFNKLRSDREADLKKIVPIQGDITEPELGISGADQQMLAETVSVVFHSAATVKFDEALKLSVTINILGTKRLVNLCHSMRNLEALIHVSTAYCNCDRVEVKEEIYETPYDPDCIIQAMEWMDDDLVNTLTPKLIGNRPNTYTFTKALTEHMLLNICGDLPVAIVRPSIVISSVKDPMAGWVDNWNGPTGIIAAAGKGFFRTMLCHEDKIADLVPVDIVINLMICAAWKTAISRPSDSIVIYNCCTGQKAPITWKEFVGQCFGAMRKHPLSNMMWYPDGQCRSNVVANYIVKSAFHFLPAYILDGISWLSGKKPMMIKVQQKLDKAATCLTYFSTREWKFLDDNSLKLYSNLSLTDRQIFPFDVRLINWPAYIEDYVLGIRQFMFKESPSSIPKARKTLTRYYYLHRITQLLAVLAILRVLLRRSAAMRRYLFFFLDLVIRLARMMPVL
ncbi:acyl-CoA reductase [Nesidiocoris tenuis]|uniref:Fatty acyl-CoA reductase n=2 Tax=Nesidiocoris tenuis TaxID=355587 RepID=A0ABN7ATS9_9HEMI|nr:acyl-CoA reductase [Nesidiocoris tenuis]